MLDSGYNFGVINWFDVVRPTQLPSFPGEFGANGNTFFGVCQTRFGVKSSTNTGLGELKTIFEFSRRRKAIYWWSGCAIHSLALVFLLE
jgi:hypothetical protein